MDTVYAGISLVTLVIGVTQVIKQAGAPKKAIQPIAIALAFLVFGGSKLVDTYPQTKLIFDILFTGLTGISAIGLYDVTKSFIRSTGAEETPQ